MFDSVHRVGVAVSGGADSVCLLHVLQEFGVPCLTVLHLDHQLRGEESRADAAFVRELAVRLGLPLIARTLTLPAGGNLEENARNARVGFYREAIASGAVERIAVGHTRSDQAETVLFRLLRGTGPTGLAGIRAVTADGVVRPLIEVERADVEAYLRERGIPWREDSTNSSRRFARNRIRYDLLPQIEQEWNPEIVGALARVADQAAADEEWWVPEIERLAAERFELSDGSVLADAKAIGELPDAVARRLVRRAIEMARGDLRAVEFFHIEEVLRLARSKVGSGRVQGPRLDICRSFKKMRFGGAAGEGYCLSAPVPGVVRIPGTRRVICLELIEKRETLGASESVYNDGMGFVDWGRVAGSLELRSWAPGDRYQPKGNSGVNKLKTFFQNARVPSWERVHWPVLVDRNGIVWTRQFGSAAELAPGPESRVVLCVRETEAT